MAYGMFRVASAIPSVRVADIKYNTEQIIQTIDKAVESRVRLLVFPELCITGYSCQDLFRQQLLLDEARKALCEIARHTENLPIVAVVGVPVRVTGRTYDCAAVVCNGNVEGLVAKTHLANSGGKCEKKWFAPHFTLVEQPTKLTKEDFWVTERPQLFNINGETIFGVEIGEDLWAVNPTGTFLCEKGADIIVNLSACNELVGRNKYLHALLSQQSARTMSAYVYSSCGFGESTQDVVFGGNALIYENSHLLAEANRFSIEPQLVIADVDLDLLRHTRSTVDGLLPKTNDNVFTMTTDLEVPTVPDGDTPASSPLRPLSPLPFIPKDEDMADTCEEILHIQTMGLAQRLQHIGCKKVVIGISGGLDSTLALLVAVRTFDLLHLDRKGIIAITMPGFGTSTRTHDNATALMKALGVGMREISIAKAVEQHFQDIGHDASERNATYENAQARERTQILMDVANDEGGIVVGTGDLSELALGWATYNGDHMSMYGVNADVPKTLIRYIVKHVAQTMPQISELLEDIVATPISPELLPDDAATGKKQQTEDIVGPYELHDFFLFYTVRYGFSPAKVFYLAKNAFDRQPKEIKHWLQVFYRRFFSQQFKRSCMPDGPKVGSVGLSPRGDWQMPSDATARLWLDEIEAL